jgi:hypothetical protein
VITTNTTTTAALAEADWLCYLHCCNNLSMYIHTHCRLGKGLGVDFCHCMKCNACISMAPGMEDHKCLTHSLEGNCPICSASMFESTQQIKVLLYTISYVEPCAAWSICITTRTAIVIYIYVPPCSNAFAFSIDGLANAK